MIAHVRLRRDKMDIANVHYITEVGHFLQFCKVDSTLLALLDIEEVCEVTTSEDEPA